MTEIHIPVAMSGPGSQPVEADGAEIDILQMPSGMDTYAAPLLPEAEDIEDLRHAKFILNKLLLQMHDYTVDMPVLQFDLELLDAANLDLVDQVLGEGEVSLVLSGDLKARIQESVLAGVWRVRYLDENDNLLRDVVEVAAIPDAVTNKTFARASSVVDGSVESAAEGILNAPSLVAEINDKVAEYKPGDESHIINLTLLPQTEEDLSFLSERLGAGVVTILSRGYGNCRITSTATKNVWWVQYYNSQDKNILNSLEITQVPNVACAAQEDIDDSAERLAEIMDVYQ